MRQEIAGGGGRMRPATAVVVARRFALAITVVAALSCAACASAALASNPEWLVNGKSLTVKQAVEWKNQSLTLDYGESQPYWFEVTCSTSGEGYVYPRDPEEELLKLGAKITITKTAYSCGVPSGQCKRVKIEGFESSTRLTSEGTKALLEKGLFKLDINCEEGSEKIIDTCGVSALTPLKNESTGVLATLEGKNATCAETPEGRSSLHGKITLKATGSGTLSVS